MGAGERLALTAGVEYSSSEVYCESVNPSVIFKSEDRA